MMKKSSYTPLSMDRFCWQEANILPVSRAVFAAGARNPRIGSNSHDL
jgi:hypothetical protein